MYGGVDRKYGGTISVYLKKIIKTKENTLHVRSTNFTHSEIKESI